MSVGISTAAPGPSNPSAPGRKVLDPRLRRLVHDLAQQATARLRADVDSAFITSSQELQPAQAPDPQALFKRVLVKLDRDLIPAAMAGLSWSKIIDEFYSVNVPINKLTDLARTPGVQFISAGHAIGIALDSSRAEVQADIVQASPPPGLGRRGRGVIVGIIDFGCDFTLDDFRLPSGATRIDWLWDQSLTPTAGEHSPPDFPHGVEYTAADINFTLGVATTGGVTVRHSASVSSHGTHVMGIAVGNGRSADPTFPAGQFIGVAPEATIIFVHPDTTDQHSTFTDSVHVAEAISYIFRRAQAAGLPCVINLSLGQNGGSHDGESVVERAIDRLLEVPGRAFVVAAGNEQVYRGHASGTVTVGVPRMLAWRVGGPIPLPSGPTTPGPDRTPNEMEIWYSSRDRLQVRVIDPVGNATPFAVPDGPPVDHPLPGGNRVFIESERFTVMNGDARVYIEVSPDAAVPAIVKSGVWQVEIQALEARDGRFDAWIERDTRDRKNRFADQSIFDGGDFDPVMTLGTPATTRLAISVASYRHGVVPPVASNFSSRGMTRDRRPKPDLAAPGDPIRSSNAQGGRPNPASPGVVYPVRIGKSGTSMAAPHVAGTCALLLEHDPRLTASQIAKVLVASARPHPGGAGYDPAFGFGLLDTLAALRMV